MAADSSGPGWIPATLDAAEYGAADVTAALTRLLESESFASSRRSRDFLAYVVTETLAGRGHRLSERTVGRRALGRSDLFDGRVDSSVRVQATRVRGALRRYYENEGVHDQVRILLPAGTYVPSFERCDDGIPEIPTDSEPGIVVLRLDDAGQPEAALIGTLISEALVHRLAGFPELRVIGPTSATSSDPRRIGRDLHVRYVLQGAVVARDGAVRLSARLTDATTGEVVWSIADTQDEESFTGFDVEDRWAAAIAGELGDYTGVVLRHELSMAGPPSGSATRAARLAYYAHLESGARESIATVAAALDRALAGDRSPALLAMRASIHNTAVHEGTSADPESDLDTAVELARECLALDARNPHAHLVLGTTARIRRQWDVAARHAEEAVAITPFHPTNLMTAGLLISLSGDWDRGIRLMREGFRLNPRHPGHAHAAPALGRILADDDAEALAEASLVHAPDQVWGALYRALALAGLGHLDQAREEMAEVLAIEPTFLDDPLAPFRKGMRCTDEHAEVLLRHFAPFTTAAQPGLDDPASAPNPREHAEEMAAP